MFKADNPLSPLFMLLVVGVLIDLIYAWSGMVKGRLPNTRTSLRGARVGGLLAMVSLLLVLLAYYSYLYVGQFQGTLALLVAAGLFVAGIVLSERIAD